MGNEAGINKQPKKEGIAIVITESISDNAQRSSRSIMPSSTGKSAAMLVFATCVGYTFLMLHASLNNFGCLVHPDILHYAELSRLVTLSPWTNTSTTESLITTLTNGILRQNNNDNHVDMLSNIKLESTRGFLNLSSPIWPYAPPASRNDKCKVIFRDPNLRLCHVIPWGANFGDEIGPPVVKRILELYFRCSTSELPTFNLWEKMNTDGIMNRTQPCMMSVGSMFRMVRTGDHLWGTGVAYDHVVPHRCKTTKEPFGGQDLVTNLTVYSTRGPKSAQHMEQYCSSFIKGPLESAGDGAVLIPFIFPEMFRFSAFERENDRKPYCVIPHHYERTHGGIKGTPKNQILSVQRAWESMTMELLKCDKVFSSSLHGIIMAEILGIPNRRLRMTNKPGDFKFADFYESYRREGEPMPWTTNIKQALNQTVSPLSLQERSGYAARVLKTFPIHLFTTVDE
jgi:hypothetical protein